ncbi:hypothetical protein ACFWWT_35380 [Streptomyces sp. NPDC058676]|uniref:hypothetical protein n=1 Tax=unclassified Streptomyces TaxID=2593676 RepID=UPI0036512D02
MEAGRERYVYRMKAGGPTVATAADGLGETCPQVGIRLLADFAACALTGLRLFASTPPSMPDDAKVKALVGSGDRLSAPAA